MKFIFLVHDSLYGMSFSYCFFGKLSIELTVLLLRTCIILLDNHLSYIFI